MNTQSEQCCPNCHRSNGVVEIPVTGLVQQKICKGDVRVAEKNVCGCQVCGFNWLSFRIPDKNVTCFKCGWDRGEFLLIKREKGTLHNKAECPNCGALGCETQFRPFAERVNIVNYDY